MTFEAHLRAIIREEVSALIAALKADLAAVESAVKPKASKAKAAPATEPAPPAPAATSAAATAPAAANAPTPEVAPTYPAFDTLKKAVLALAGMNRDAAVKILAGFKVVNASELKPEQYQAVIDAMEERKAELDAAAAKASLV